MNSYTCTMKPASFCICHLINETKMALNIKMPFKDPHNVLDGLLDGAVGGEGLQLLLDSGQRVGELLVAEDRDGLLYPVQQV